MRRAPRPSVRGLPHSLTRGWSLRAHHPRDDATGRGLCLRSVLSSKHLGVPGSGGPTLIATRVGPSRPLGPPLSGAGSTPRMVSHRHGPLMAPRPARRGPLLRRPLGVPLTHQRLGRMASQAPPFPGAQTREPPPCGDLEVHPNPRPSPDGVKGRRGRRQALPGRQEARVPRPAQALQGGPQGLGRPSCSPRSGLALRAGLGRQGAPGGRGSLSGPGHRGTQDG